MNTLAGWDGPECIEEGVYRYSRYFSWIRLYIDVEGGEFYGGTCGAASNFEVEREDGHWMRFETDLAATPAGEPVLRLRGYSTLDVVFERISQGASPSKRRSIALRIWQHTWGAFMPEIPALHNSCALRKS